MRRLRKSTYGEMCLVTGYLSLFRGYLRPSVKNKEHGRLVYTHWVLIFNKVCVVFKLARYYTCV